ncbi:heavy metal translocating P-type ATPase [Paenibacillus typhae]|uniref:Cd2+/Zn2+-exporting ATPase n=1 Tax=Paenibacillus typhae TaxID=1174501 RepID=A0A1G8F7M1_9BACL|nr:heavy metal translocating P-type ATPase [Paenibacillus typhae]SDH78154.1 Cd2+/Zn2+-exporting ATPase [Paenibacillus typhae]
METANAATVKRKVLLKGLDCANCALKIENGVQKIEGVRSCSVNYVKQTMIIELNSTHEEEIMGFVRKKVNSLEPDIKFISGIKGTVPKLSAHSHNEASHGELVVKSKPLNHEDSYNTSHNHSHDDSKDNVIDDSHGHGHDHGESGVKTMILRLVASIVVGATGMIFNLNGIIGFSLFIIAYLIIGGDILLRAVKNIIRGQVFDEYFLMSIATIGAFVIGEYPEGVAVMLFYQVGELFQSIAVNRSRKSISSLLDLRPDFANVKIGDETKQVNPEEVRVGERIIVRPGEKVPLDGKVIDGHSAMDTSALTGESVPREVASGDDVLSGFININGVLTIEVSKTFGESTVAKILDLVENASSNKAETEKFITKFARYYTPVVVIIAVLLATIPPLLFSGATFSDWLYRALVFLVISCPCALVVSIPLGFFGGIGAASKNGVLVKGSNYLEGLNNVKYVVFDKTGTLTKGAFKVKAIVSASDWNQEHILLYAAYAETYSSHPIALSIKEAYGFDLDEHRITDYNEISGHGIQVTFENSSVLAGNEKLMQSEEISFVKPTEVGTIVHVAINHKYAGYIVIADEVKDDSATAIRSLKQMGVKKIIMLTGDNKAVGEAIGRSLEVDEVHAELLPQHKVEELEKLDAKKLPKEKIIFVGDGINDTPVLARADIGVAMGGLGSDAAIEAADIVIMTDEPSKLAAAMQVAKKTRNIVWQNIVFALLVKGLFLLLGAFGIATMWEAVIGDVGVSLIAVLNAMRVLKIKPEIVRTS